MKRSRILGDPNAPQRHQKRLKHDSGPTYSLSLSHGQNSRFLPFQYRQIDRPGQIRLLKVHINDRRQLCGSFTYGSLCEVSSKYTAISYCWGNTSHVGKLWFDGDFYLDLGATAKNILRHRAKHFPDEYVWIDTVCIDQESDAEKSQQVQMIREIYENAENVIVWLDYTKYRGWGTKTINYINFVTKLLRRSYSTKSSIGNSPTDVVLKSKMINWSLNHGGLNALARLVCEPYFSRTWVIQEIVSAASAYIFCDGAIIKWDDFAKTVNLSDKYKLFSRFRYKRRNALPDHFHAHLDAVSYIEGLRERRAKGLPLKIQDLLIKARYAHSTKDVDKIYALRSLATGLDPSELAVDYTVPTKELYIKTTHFLLFRRKAFDSLESAGTWKHKGGDSLPSWVIDFRWVPHKGIMIDPGRTRAGGRRVKLQYLEGNRLQVEGRIISQISSTIGPSNHRSPGQLLILAAKIKNWYRQACKETGQSHNQAKASDGTPGTFPVVAMPSSGASQSHFTNEALEFENSLRRLKALKDAKGRQTQDTRYLDNLAHFISDKNIPRRLFVSYSGHIGLAPTTVEHNDLVCVLHGLRFPFILRQDQDPATGADVKTYTLIGEAFVPDLMRGEGLKMGEPEDFILS